MASHASMLLQETRGEWNSHFLAFKATRALRHSELSLCNALFRKIRTKDAYALAEMYLYL